VKLQINGRYISPDMTVDASDSSSPNSSNAEGVEDASKLGKKILMTDNKRAKVEGRHLEEPSLKENP
jgi:hypothetical protein